MGAQSDRLRCEVCQNLFLSPMNTGLLRPAVATALTVYGIETMVPTIKQLLKLSIVATALTVYGIETRLTVVLLFKSLKKVATALTVYGIETYILFLADSIYHLLQQHLPFTVLKQSIT